MTISKSVLFELETTHEMYGDYNQQERDDCVFMAKSGHPFAEPYKALRAFFDGLKYACNSGARYYSYRNAHESAEYWAPKLQVSWHPSGALRKFGSIFPAHDNWEKYLHAAAEVAWEGAAPELDGGQWIVQTSNKKLRDALQALAAARDEVAISISSVEGKPKVSMLTLRLSEDFHAHQAILDILGAHHADCVLPARTSQEDAEDTRELPLAEKKFSLSNVAALTITDRHVLAPLIPLGNQDLVLDTVSKLVKLFDKGFPFEQAQDWLQRFMTPKGFKSLQNQYAHDSASV